MIRSLVTRELQAEDVSKPAPEAVDMAAFLRGARQKFIVGFQATIETFETLFAQSDKDPAAAAELLRRMHRLAGLAGSVGFPTVSKRAAALEETLGDASPPDRLHAAKTALESIREAYTTDLTLAPAWSSIAEPRESAALRVLIADDDAEQRTLLTQCLLNAGHSPIVRDSGVGLLECARVEQPSVILLDVNMPGIDGFGTCQLLKADAETCGIPIVLMSTRSALNDRLAGLSLGADDYLCKPIEFPELLLRLRLLGVRREAQQDTATCLDGHARPLAYETFLARARAQLARASASIALVRLPTYQADAAWTAIREDTRHRDLVGWYDQSHLVLLLPEMSALDARDRLSHIIQRLPGAVRRGVHAGVASSPLGAWAIEAAIADADEALAEARSRGEAAAIKSAWRAREAPKTGLTVLVADDDPDMARILDAQIQAAGYRTVLAFDGEDALGAIETSRPDAVVLDLMLPKMTGFDVLQALAHSPGKPRTLVLSARSREDDITRAFELGADDYLTKPFSPAELVARLSRLLR